MRINARKNVNVFSGYDSGGYVWMVLNADADGGCWCGHVVFSQNVTLYSAWCSL